MADINARTRLLIGTTADWAAHNLVLGLGELVVERAGAQIKMKVGDGAAAYSALPFVTADAIIPPEYLTEAEANALFLRLSDVSNVQAANKVPRMDGNGRLAYSMLPLPSYISASSGPLDAGKLVALSSTGKIDPSMITVTTGGYKGTVDATAPKPAGTFIAGDYFVNTANGLAHASWGTPGGTTVSAGQQIIFNGATWDVIGTGSSAFLPLSGGTLDNPGNLRINGTLAVGGVPVDRLTVYNGGVVLMADASVVAPEIQWRATDNSVRGYFAMATQTAGSTLDEQRFYQAYGFKSFYTSGVENLRLEAGGSLYAFGQVSSGAQGRADGAYVMRRSSDGVGVGSLAFNTASNAIEISSGVETTIVRGSSSEIARFEPGGLRVGFGAIGPEYGRLAVMSALAPMPGGASSTPAGHAYAYLGSAGVNGPEWIHLAGVYNSVAHKAGITLQDYFLDNGQYGGRFIQAANGDLSFGNVVNGVQGASNATLAVQMTLTSAGRLGLGTNGPVKKLHVSGNNDGIRLSHSFGLEDFSELSFNSGGLAGSAAAIRSARATDASIGNEADLRFYTLPGSADAAANGIERMRIRADGPVMVFPDGAGTGGIEVGFRNLPLGTLAGSDISPASRGKIVSVTANCSFSAGWGYTAGEIYSIYNDGGGEITIGGVGVTMRRAGTGLSGASFNLVSGGIASVWFVTPVIAVVSGSGVKA
jgi:hypothetical protein